MMNEALTTKITEKYNELFKSTPSLFKAPGRINLIGEHTDYNEGFVLPAAIDKAIYFAAGKNDENKLRLFSIDFDGYFEIELDQLVKTSLHWVNYLVGTAYQVEQKGYKFQGVDCVFGGDIPVGAGLSSSAALECGFATCINELYNLDISKDELIFIAQKAEHEFAGVQCGIMDQFASTFGKEGHVVRLDCRSMEREYFPIDNEHYDIVLIETQVKHSLASSEYNTRRKECEAGVAAMQKIDASVKSLRNASMDLLEKVKAELTAKEYNRCHYVIGEIRRVEEACADLVKGKFEAFGKLMFETHWGLSKEYEVSCPELDLLVEVAEKSSDVVGSRLMGGGFGGCTINLIKTGKTEAFVKEATKAFKKKFDKEPLVHLVKISDGAGKI